MALWRYQTPAARPGPYCRCVEPGFFQRGQIWEVSIKAALGKIEADPNEMLVALQSGGFDELAVTARYASAVMRLPDHHRDPFDRMLVAQSMVESLALLTDDRVLSQYGAAVILAN